MPLKIVILSIEYPPGPGGIGTYAYQTAKHLHQLGCSIQVASPQSFATREEIEEFNRSQPFLIQNFPDRGLFLLEAFERLYYTFKLVLKSKPDWVVTFGKKATWLGALVAWIGKVKLIATGSGSEFNVKEFLDTFLTKWAFRKAQKVIFNSEFTHSLAINKGFIFNESYVIPLGADDKVFRSGLSTDALRKRLNLQDKRVILTVGQLSERKAQDIVILALPEVLKKIPQAVYLIAGIPTLQDKLQALAEALGVSEQVRFLGKVPQDELPYLYNLAEVFVMVSRESKQGEVEGFGISVLEAALCGVPAIVSEGTGLIETIQPGQTGLVVPQESPADTAQALIYLLKNDALRKTMGEAARQFALQHGTWEKRCEEFFNCLK